MLESEEKRKRLLETIERWCDHVKATPLLRDGDISGLVNTILDEFYHITLCCGHKVRDFSDGVIVTYTDYVFDRSIDEDGDQVQGDATICGDYCKDCIEDMKTWARDLKVGKE